MCAGGLVVASSPVALAVYLQDAWGNLATAEPYQLAVSFALQGGDTFTASIAQVLVQMGYLYRQSCHIPSMATPYVVCSML